MKRLPIINQTPKQELIAQTATLLRCWSSRYLGGRVEGIAISGISPEDLRVDCWGIIRAISGKAIEVALNSVIDGGKPGTIGGAIRDYALSMPDSQWKPFKWQVRKAAGVIRRGF